MQNYQLIKTDEWVKLTSEIQRTLSDGSVLTQRVEILIREYGLVEITYQDMPLVPMIGVDKLKELIAEYDNLCPSEPA